MWNSIASFMLAQSRPVRPVDATGNIRGICRKARFSLLYNGAGDIPSLESLV